MAVAALFGGAQGLAHVVSVMPLPDKSPFSLDVTASPLYHSLSLSSSSFASASTPSSHISALSSLAESY